MDRFLLPAAASIVIGLLLGAIAILGTTELMKQDDRSPTAGGDKATSVLNRVEYGERR